MSAAVAEPPAVSPANGKPVSPVEYVKGLSLEDKEAVFFALLAEAREHGERAGTLDLRHGSEYVGFFMTLEAWHRLRELPTQTAEGRERAARAEADLSKTFDINEFNEECRREEAVASSP